MHFLHQTDIRLALHKHNTIYSISSFLFSPSHSLSLSPTRAFAFLLCKQEPGVKCVSTGLVPFLSQASIYLKICSTWLPSPPSHSFPPLCHLHPIFPPPITLSLPLPVFPLPNCFAVDLTAMINDLEASGKQTELALLLPTSLLLICQLYVCSHFWFKLNLHIRLYLRIYSKHRTSQGKVNFYIIIITFILRIKLIQHRHTSFNYLYCILCQNMGKRSNVYTGRQTLRESEKEAWKLVKGWLIKYDSMNFKLLKTQTYNHL